MFDMTASTIGRKTVMINPYRVDRLLIKPAAGARPVPPCTRGRIIRKARTKHRRSLGESHATRRHQAGPRQTDPLSLTVTRREGRRAPGTVAPHRVRVTALATTDWVSSVARHRKT